MLRTSRRPTWLFLGFVVAECAWPSAIALRQLQGLQQASSLQGTASSGGQEVAATPGAGRLRVVTFDDKENWKLAYLKLSAKASSLEVTRLGADQANKIHWGENMALRTASLKRFALDRDRADRLEDDDVALFVDAWDTLILADEAEILEKFVQLERRHPQKGVFFNAEDICDPEGPWCAAEEADAAEQSPISPFKYLNAGIFIGRGAAIRRFFEHFDIPSESPREQPLLHEQFISAPNKEVMHLVRDCELFQAGMGHSEEELRVEVRDGRVNNLGGGNCPTGARPAVVHFNGIGHSKFYVDTTSDPGREFQNGDLVKGIGAMFGKVNLAAAKMWPYGQGINQRTGMLSTHVYQYFRKLFPEEGQFLEPFGRYNLADRIALCQKCSSGQAKAEFCEHLGTGCTNEQLFDPRQALLF